MKILIMQLLVTYVYNRLPTETARSNVSPPSTIATLRVKHPEGAWPCI